MPRKPRCRIVVPGRPHHVVIRGNNRRRLFSYSSCYRRFLRYLADALRHTGCRLHALALMTNHVHLVITPPDAAALSSCVKRLAQRYAVQRNARFAASGKGLEELGRLARDRDEALVRPRRVERPDGSRAA